MPKLSRALTGSVLSAFVALGTVPASAAMFSDTTASLAVQIATLPSPTMMGTGSASSDGGPGSMHTVPAGILALATGVTLPIVPSFVGLAKASLPAGVNAGPGSFNPNGVMPVNGAALFFKAGGGGAVGSVPLAPLGGGATTMFSIDVLQGTLQGATWQGAGTLGPQVLSAMSAAVAIPITVTATAYDNRTSNGGGMVQLIAPATGELGGFGSIPTFGVLTLNYVPEPGVMALGLVGATVLIAAGRRKLRKS